VDDALKITSITTDVGVICREWIEEAFELKSKSAFETVEESLRGILPDPSGFYQTVITFNPWSDRSWLKSEFFDEDTRRPHTRSFTTTYKDNPWLNDDYVASLQDMVKRNPNRARVAVYGDWGIAEGLVFDGLFEQRDFSMEEIASLPKAVGLDFGFKHDPTAGEFMAIDQQNRVVYIYDEFYQQGMLTQQIAEAIGQHKGYGLQITADSAEQRLISELSGVYGVPNIIGAGKGKDSVSQGIQYMQSYHFVVHPRVKGLLEEFNTYVYSKDKFGNWTNTPEDANNHACLTGDTLVETTNGSEPISELVGKSGNVYSLDTETGNVVVDEFSNVFKTREHAAVYEIELEDGRTVKATADHKFLTQNGWKELADLTEDDEIISIAPQSSRLPKGVKIKSIKFSGYEDVYDMYVKNHHNFAVNGGFIVHNCDAFRYAMEPFMFRTAGHYMSNQERIQTIKNLGLR